MKDFNFIDSQSPEVIEDLYNKYRTSPESVDASWRNFFQGFEYGQLPDQVPKSVYVDVPETYQGNPGTSVPVAGGESSVAAIVEAYRKWGHLYANVNPIAPYRGAKEYLKKEKWGLSQSEEGKEFLIARQITGKNSTLGDLIKHLEATYCGSIGVEYKYISNEVLIQWLEQRMEPSQNKHPFTAKDKTEIFTDIVHAEGFETFINTKFVGKKRFSLEGACSLIPALESLLDYGGGLGVEDFVIGMAHRGRLNTLVNVLKKPYSAMFTEFEGGFLPKGIDGDGDVKYHLGFSSDRTTQSGSKVHVSLCFNPSHLEIIDPVLEGSVRAKQDIKFKGDRTKVVPVAIHGDAAFAGQGVVYETINMSQLEGFKTGGTIHIVINNQVGFTTNPRDSRSTLYCSDVMKMLEVPIFHVNGDDVEAVVHCMHMAVDIRQKFAIDVVIDMICYRKYGHNETDEPRFTQPLMYKEIDKHDSAANKYAAQLVAEKVLTQEQADAVSEQFKEALNAQLDDVRAKKPDMQVHRLEGVWKDFIVPTTKDIFKPMNSSVKLSDLQKVAKEITTVPSGFHIVPRLKRVISDRQEMAAGKKPVDWGFAENLAYATLLTEGFPVRLTGQDVRRGTFTHRQAVWNDEETEKRYIAMNELSNGKAKLSIYDSHLSEAGVLGFEFGFSMTAPNCLTIWEAQFGDFVNGAQIVIDQFISSSDSKWQRMSGLVMLLPHGYEGQGPEHSSARLERFLQMCAENNMQVANLTTPQQIFHIMRRQVQRNFRLPLIIMSPKSLLRHPKVVCSLEDLAQGEFHEVIPDTESGAAVQRLILCTGKVYYDLDEKRAEMKNKKLGVVRVEQMHPFPKDALTKVLAEYSPSVDLVWLQEEPENMGAWRFMRDKLEKMGRKVRVIARKESASPAIGSEKKHKYEQDALIAKVWEGL